MKDGESLDATLGSNSKLSHCCRESCNFTFTCTKSHRETYFRSNSHLNRPNFLEVNLPLAVHDAVLWEVGGDFLRFRQRSDPLTIIELFRGRVLSFIKNINCTLRRKRHSSGKSPVAHLLARMSSPRNERLLWPAPAKETMASKCFFTVIHVGSKEVGSVTKKSWNVVVLLTTRQ